MAARHSLTPRTPPSTSWEVAGTQEQLRAKFLALRTREDVAALVDVPFWQLDWHVRRSPVALRYYSFKMRKRQGGTRDIAVPNVGLKAIQKKLATILAATYRPPKCVHGFAAKRSILTNAQPHGARWWVLNIDLKDFFPSITFPRVRGMFIAKPYSLPPNVATLLAQLVCSPPERPVPVLPSAEVPTAATATTVPTKLVPGALPQGAPTSPIMSNMLCARMDGQLVALAREQRTTYTRYADDITFSCRRAFPTQLAVREPGSKTTTVGSALHAVIHANGFEVNQKKVRLQGRATRQEVTGLIVNRTPNVRREAVREVRAMLHAWRKHGEKAAQAEFVAKYDRKHRRPGAVPSFRQVVRGKIGHLRMVRGEADPVAKRLTAQYRALVGLPAIVELNKYELLREATWVLQAVYDDEDGNAVVMNGTAFAVRDLGVLTCAHVIVRGLEAFRWNKESVKIPIKVLHQCAQRDLALLEHPAPGHELDLAPVRRPEIEDSLLAIGFMDFHVGDAGQFMKVDVVGHRQVGGSERCLVNGPIVAGMSGGPVVDQDGRVVGVISHGAPSLRSAVTTEMHAFVPRTVLEKFVADARAAIAGRADSRDDEAE